MHNAPQKCLLWGIILYLIGGISTTAMPWVLAGIESGLNFNTIDGSIYKALIYPAASIIRWGTLPLGSALIAAGIIMKYLKHLHTSESNHTIRTSNDAVSQNEGNIS